MKRIIVILFVLTASTSVYSQFCKGDYSISLNGNYYKGSSSSGVATNSFSSIGENLKTYLSIEHYKTSKSYHGFGVGFYWGDNDMTNSLLSKKFSQIETMNLKSIKIFTNLIYGYYLQIADNLFINVSTRVGFGVLSTNFDSEYKNYQHPYGGTLDQGESADENLSFNSSESYGEFGSSISPEFNYFFSDRFGLCLHLGGIEYSILDWKKDLSFWKVDINPNIWRLGIRYIL